MKNVENRMLALNALRERIVKANSIEDIKDATLLLIDVVTEDMARALNNWGGPPAGPAA